MPASPEPPEVGLADPPPAARTVFGSRLAVAVGYAQLLAEAGVQRGLIGPSEVPRLWDRHLLNSAALAELLPSADATVLDVGSGAGLPGLPLALCRPQLRVVLLEPTARRVDFLNEAVTSLRLTDRVSVIRGRAEDVETRRTAGDRQWVTARAVAPLDRLAAWCLPLLRPGGRLLAMKGSSAADELVRHGAALARAGAGQIDVRQVGAAGYATWVVSVERAAPARGTRPPRRTGGRR